MSVELPARVPFSASYAVPLAAENVPALRFTLHTSAHTSFGVPDEKSSGSQMYLSRPLSSTPTRGGGRGTHRESPRTLLRQRSPM